MLKKHTDSVPQNFFKNFVFQKTIFFQNISYSFEFGPLKSPFSSINKISLDNIQF